MNEVVQSFNRTFMELKLLNVLAMSLRMNVLIVPLWNWNRPAPIIVAKTALSFNRTFMELKLTNYRTAKGCHSSFNRTFMELKYMLKSLPSDSNV